MTRKTVKNSIKPKVLRNNCEVIKHFEPSSNHNNRRLDLNAEIPEFNNESSAQSPKRIFSPIRAKQMPKASSFIGKKVGQNQIANKRQTTKSTSSSSVELAPARQQPKSKSFHLDYPKPSRQNAIKSARTRQNSPRPTQAASFKSITDPVLLKKDLKVLSLKQEIMNNKKAIAQPQKQIFVSTLRREYSNNGRIESLKDEVLCSKNKEIMHRKILITELKTEIAEYKKFDCYQIYNTESEQNGKINDMEQVKENSDKEEEEATKELGKLQELTDSHTGSSSDCSPANIANSPSKLALRPKGQLVAKSGSINDEIIKQKLEEANQLIEKVRKALGKIKSARTIGDAEKSTSDSHASTTDIETTIQNLKLETKKLIMGDVQTSSEDSTRPQTRRCCPESDSNLLISKKSSNLIKADVSLDKTVDLPNEKVIDQKVSKTCPCFEEDLETARTRFKEMEIAQSAPDLDLERPKTRRNEIEDDLSDKLDKFRNCPEDGQLEVTSSIEALQAKLQTISESTESSFSTPRNKKSSLLVPPQKDFKTCGANTESVQVVSSGAQVEPNMKNVSTSVEYFSESKSVQTTLPSKTEGLTLDTMEVDAVLPKPKCLGRTNLQIEEIKPEGKNCRKCQIETNPIAVIFPKNDHLVCNKCNKSLTDEHLRGVCLSARGKKAKKLTVQMLPPVIINAQMVLTRTLNFSILPTGVTENRLINTNNVAFIEIGSNDQFSVIESPKKVEEAKVANVSEAYNEKVILEIADNSSHRPVVVAEMEETLYRDNSLEDSRELVYKSYQLVNDNEVDHDPGVLDEEQQKKISSIDSRFYQTFIDPKGPPYEKEETHEQLLNWSNFESKSSDITKSLELSVVEKHARVREQATLTENIYDQSNDSPVVENRKSLLRARPEYIDVANLTPSEITLTISYTPTPENSIENLANDTKKDSFESFEEQEIKTIHLDIEAQAESPKTSDAVPVKDSEVIKKLQEKLKLMDQEQALPDGLTNRTDRGSLDVMNSFIKGLTQEPDVGSSNQFSSEGKNTVNNNRLNGTNPNVNLHIIERNADAPINLSLRHLEMGKNGRYKDEEHLFTQYPYSLPENDTSRPLKRINSGELQRSKLPVIPRHRLRRFCPETSNSDTVTTTSLSEGEIKCKHSLSNGEVHVCRNAVKPRLRRTPWVKIKTQTTKRGDVTYQRNFDLNDPKVTIEQRRNYFNNWVTYYVKTQEVYDSSTSSCSNNK